jgi:predicted transcriptional regulator
LVAEEKTSKLHDIKETASDTVEILRQIGTPGVQESMDKVRETATIAKQIMESLKTPEIVKNIENLRLISENMNAASSNIQKAMEQLKETGVIDEAKELIRSTKSKINSFGEVDGNSITGQNLRDVTIAIKEMLVSITGLVYELKVTVASSKKSVTIHNIEDTIKEAADIYKTVR